MSYTGAELIFPKGTLKYWLYLRIESGTYLGLIWENVEEMTFRLPWVSQNEPNSEEYYELFKDWAQRNSPTDYNPSRAKSNFGSLLNNSEYFEYKGTVKQQTGTYRIYKFILSQQERAAINTLPNHFSEDHRETSMQNATLVDTEPIHTYPVSDNTVNGFLPTTYVDEAYADVNMSSIPSLESEHQVLVSKFSAMGITGEELMSCEYRIEYMGKNQRMDHIINMEKNCKFIYGSHENAVAVESVNMKKNSPYFSDQWYELADPIVNSSESLMTILKNMNTGISIWFDTKELCINVVRHCRTQVFSFDVVGSNDSPCLLARDRPYTIFSYKQFLFDQTKSTIVPEIKPPDVRLELVAGVRPKEKGVIEKGVKIILKPCGAVKFSNCDDPSTLQDLCVSLDSSSLEKELRNMNLNTTTSQ